MALEPLKIVKRWFKNSVNVEACWDEIADKVSAFSSRVNNNLKQLGVDINGEDYDFNNQGKGTQTTSLTTRIASLENETPTTTPGSKNVGLDLTNIDTVKLVQADGTALSASSPAQVTFNDKANPGELISRNLEAELSLLLTGCHWGLDTLGDETDEKLWILIIDDGGTLILGVDFTGGRKTVTPADAEIVAADVNSEEKVFVTSDPSSESNVSYVGWVNANFDDTGNASGENYWTIQTGAGDINLGRGEQESRNKTIDGDLTVEGDLEAGTIDGVYKNPIFTTSGVVDVGFDFSTATTVKMVYKDGTALSALQPAYVSIRDSSNTTQVVRRKMEADMSVLLTGAHWGLNTTGDQTDFKLYIVLIDNAGTPTLGVTTIPWLTYVATADVVTAPGSATTAVKVLCSAAVAADSCCTYIGCVNADFDDTGGASENLWTIQTAIGDLELATNLSKDRETGTVVGARGVAKSASTGSYSTSTTSLTDVTNASVTITTSGRPVMVMLVGHGGGSAYIGGENNSTQDISCFFVIDRAGTNIGYYHLYNGDVAVGGINWHLHIPPAAVAAIDIVSAGTYIYKLRAQSLTADTHHKVNQCALVAFEL